MDRPPFVPIGRIVKTHGVNGEVSVVPAAGLPFVFPGPVEVWVVPPPESAPRRTAVLSVRPGPKGPLATLRDVTDVETARSLVGATLVASGSDLPDEWEEPEADPVGLAVADEARGPLGEVAEVIVTGANDVWVVEGGRFGQVLLPVIDDVLVDVDWEERTARVRLLPGLIEED